MAIGSKKKIPVLSPVDFSAKAWLLDKFRRDVVWACYDPSTPTRYLAAGPDRAARGRIEPPP